MVDDTVTETLAEIDARLAVLAVHRHDNPGALDRFNAALEARPYVARP